MNVLVYVFMTITVLMDPGIIPKIMNKLSDGPYELDEELIIVP